LEGKPRPEKRRSDPFPYSEKHYHVRYLYGDLFFCFPARAVPHSETVRGFSMAGLFSSFLTAFCVYPLFKMPKDEKRYFHFFLDKKILRAKNQRLT
jgi:hypothetical protein